MRSLGYSRVISMENFRNPNFELVSDLLYWLVKRYDPEVMLSDEISTETDRVAFLKSAANIMITKARIKLNLKRLYGAEGLAVKELLKIATMLYKATNQIYEQEDDLASVDGFNLDSKSFDVKLTRQLTSEITKSGAALFDGLEKEMEMKGLRNQAISSNMDLDEIEVAVQEAIQQVKDNVVNANDQLEELEKDEKNLNAKIDKRKAELGRSEKRLSTLKSVRPAYMDEFEKLQGQLQELYIEYLERFRNLEYLESHLEAHRKREQEKAEAAERHMKKMQKKLKEEEMRILRGEAQADDDMFFDDSDSEELDDDDMMDGQQGPMSRVMRMTGEGGGAMRGTSRGGQVMGSLDMDDEDDDLSDDLLSDSDSTHVSVPEGGSDLDSVDFGPGMGEDDLGDFSDEDGEFEGRGSDDEF